MRAVGSGWNVVLLTGTSVALAVTTMTVSSPGLAADTSCRVENVTTSAGTTADLQTVFDRARPGDTIRVRGVCVGNFVIDKSLTVVGDATSTLPTPTLDGNRGSVLSLIGDHDRRLRVILKDLSVTHSTPGIPGRGIFVKMTGILALKGSSSVSANTTEHRGGGIFARRGDVSIRGVSSVMANTARWGGGIKLRSGTATLADSTVMTTNSASAGGGGIFSHGTVLLTDQASISTNSSAQGGGIFNHKGVVVLKEQSDVSGNLGGGIYHNHGTVTMKRSASVTSNVAGENAFGSGVTMNRGTFSMGGASSVTANSSGGISVFGGTVTMSDDARVNHNTCPSPNDGGGGVILVGDTARLVMKDSSQVMHNTANPDGAVGGGIEILRGSVLMRQNSLVSENRAAKGGGIWIFDETGSLRLAGESSITGNKASIRGGGIALHNGGLVTLGPRWTGTVCGNDPDDWPGCAT